MKTISRCVGAITALIFAIALTCHAQFIPQGSNPGGASATAVNPLGTTNAPNCDFNLGYVCTWTQTSSIANLTVANIPGTIARPVIVTLLVFAKDPTATSSTNLPANFLVTGLGDLTWTGGYNLFTVGLAGGLNGLNPSQWACDGTNCYLLSQGLVHSQVLTLSNQILLTQNTGDNVISTMPRMPLTFSLNQQTALLANEHMGTFLAKFAMTMQNVVFDEQNVTCATPAVVSIYDCGIAAGACLTGRTSTLVTSPSLTTANSGLSILGVITTAPVAAGHYITAEVSAGACSAFQATATMMAIPQ